MSLFCLVNEAQTIYTYNGVYRIELPDKLELQDSELNNVKQIGTKGQKTQININTQSGKIVFQQKGLNDDVKAAYSKYCRVMIEYYKEDSREPVYGRGDQIVVDRVILYSVTESVKEACRRNKTPFIKLMTIQPLTINGFPVLYYSYKRKGWENTPPVIVNSYGIFNRYESAVVTFSYREAERENWKSIHDNIMNTFDFTKRY